MLRCSYHLSGVSPNQIPMEHIMSSSSSARSEGRQPILSLRKVSKNFGAVAALTDIDLDGDSSDPLVYPALLVIPLDVSSWPVYEWRLWRMVRYDVFVRWAGR